MPVSRPRSPVPVPVPVPVVASGRRRVRRALAAAVLAALAGAAAAQTALPPAPAQGLAQQPGSRAFAQAIAAAAAGDEAVAGFFRDRGYAAFWTLPEAAGRRAALLAALDRAAAHGLPAGRYDPAALIAQARAARTEGDRGRLEVAMTLAFLAYARDVQTGVLEPARIDPGLKREVAVRDRRANLEALAAAAQPAAFLAALPPASAEYGRLMAAKLALEAAIAAGGWGPTVPGERLEPGQRGPEVVALRDRLVAMGYIDRSATEVYDAVIERAVRRFQSDHGLDPSGVAGASTLAALNEGPEARLAAVVVAMERERWLGGDRGARHIWVNLADFTAKIVDEGAVIFSTRAVIGDTPTEKHTPEFSHAMTYMELNPDWTVPPGIIRRDYLPRLQRNPNALGHLQIIDRRGRVVPRGSIDFAAYSASNFPFTLRQSPGDANALGKVKFMFPNPYSIYLHDTPHKELFVEETRAFSNGCVRLADPFEFAYELLSRQADDPVEAFHAVLDTGRQERIMLDPPVPVHLDYRTAFSDPRGRMEYRRDIYGRDAKILAALREAGVVIPQAGG
jgi:murein L,D-transpeptidase YcbB/YkuD